MSRQTRRLGSVVVMVVLMVAPPALQGASVLSPIEGPEPPAPPAPSASPPPEPMAPASGGGFSFAFTSHAAADHGEPSVGVQPDGDVWLQAGHDLFRIRFGAGGPEWQQIPMTVRGVGTLDPFMHVDPETGRVFSGQMDGCGVIMMTDNEGASWLPSAACPLPAIDYPSLVTGPTRLPQPSDLDAGLDPIYPRATYYCTQQLADIHASCVASLDGGLTWGAPEQLVCSQTTAHARVGPDGVLYLPTKACGGPAGVQVSEDGGATWVFRPVPGSEGVDTIQVATPAIAIGASNTLYFVWPDRSMQPHVAVGSDHGRSLVEVPGAITIPGIMTSALHTAVAGDDDRAAIAFLGTKEGAPGEGVSNTAFAGAWHLFVTVTYNGGESWSTIQATPNDDPVHRGQICLKGLSCTFNLVGGPAEDRSLLDFIESAVDPTSGRIVVSLADNADANGAAPLRSVLAYQDGGLRLLSAYDGTGAPLVARAGASYLASALTPTRLAGSGAGGTPPYSFEWSVVTRPALSVVGDTAWIHRTTANPWFVPDVEGDYVLEVVVRDAAGTTQVATTVLHALAAADREIQVKNPIRIDLGELVAMTEWFASGALRDGQGVVSNLEDAAGRVVDFGGELVGVPVSGTLPDPALGTFGLRGRTTSSGGPSGVLPNAVVAADGRLAPATETLGVLGDPGFVALQDTYAGTAGFLGLFPDPTGAKTLLALFEAEAPLDPRYDLLPAGWKLLVVPHAPFANARLDLDAPPQLLGSDDVGLDLPSAGDGIGPGARLHVTRPPPGSLIAGHYAACTANFVWRDVQTGKLYLGAAGHCFLPEGRRATHGSDADFFDLDAVKTQVCVRRCEIGGALGKAYLRGDLVDLGPLVYARGSRGSSVLANDFGLVEIPDELRGLVRPGVPVWGGPHGVATLAPGDITLNYGNSGGYGETFAGKARAGIGGWSSNQGLAGGGVSGDWWVAVHPVAYGDSGGALVEGVAGSDAVLRGGGAIGVTSQLIGAGREPFAPATENILFWGSIGAGPTASRAVTLAAEAGLDLVLVSEGEDVATLPSAPVDVTAHAGDGKVSLAWTLPSTGGATVGRYQIRYGPEGGPLDQLATSAITRALVTGLANGQAYAFDVRAETLQGVGPASAVVTATPAPVPDAPQPPVAASTDHGADLTWSAPDDRGSPITGYEVRYQKAGNASVSTLSASGTSASLSGLDACDAYLVSVVASNAHGAGAPSLRRVVVPHDAPTAPPGAPGSLVAVPGDGFVRVSWNAPEAGCPIDRYTVKWTALGPPNGLTPWDGTLDVADGRSATVPGLLNGVRYWFSVTAWNANGESALAPEADATPLPSAVWMEMRFLEGGRVVRDWEKVAGYDGSSFAVPIGADLPRGLLAAEARLREGPVVLATAQKPILVPGPDVSIVTPADGAPALGTLSASGYVTNAPAPGPRIVPRTPSADVAAAIDALAAQYAATPGFLAVVPAPDSSSLLEAWFEGSAPTDLRLDLVPAGWGLQVHEGVEGRQMTMTTQSVVALPFDGVLTQADRVGKSWGLGPGTRLILNGKVCTVNFVYEDAAGEIYLGTAGHCYMPNVGPFDSGKRGVTTHGEHGEGWEFAHTKRVSVYACVASCYLGGAVAGSAGDCYDQCYVGGSTPALVPYYQLTAEVALGKVVDLTGEVVYARQRTREAGAWAFAGFDFALIRIPSEYHDLLHVDMPVWGEAKGTDEVGLGDLVATYGHGAAVGETVATMARAGVGHTDDGRMFSYRGTAVMGDSGGAAQVLDTWQIGLRKSFAAAGSVDTIYGGSAIDASYQGILFCRQAVGKCVAPVPNPYVTQILGPGVVSGTKVSQHLVLVQEAGLSIERVETAADLARARPAGAPLAPTALSATPGVGSVALSWSPAATGAAPTGYVVSHRDADGVWHEVTTTDPSATIAGLPACEPRPFKVRATNAEGASINTLPLVATPLDDGAIAPSTPANLSGGPHGRGVVLTWLPSALGCGGASYVVQIGTEPGLPTRNVTTTDTLLVLPDEALDLHVAVYAVNGVAASAPSAPILVEAPWRVETRVLDREGVEVRGWAPAQIEGLEWRAASEDLAPGVYSLEARLVRGASILDRSASRFVALAPDLTVEPATSPGIVGGRLLGLPDTVPARLGSLMLPNGSIDESHFARVAISDPAYATIHQAYAAVPGFVGMSPALDGTPRIQVFLEGASPASLPAVEIPEGWQLEVHPDLRWRDLSGATDVLDPRAADGLGPGSLVTAILGEPSYRMDPGSTPDPTRIASVSVQPPSYEPPSMTALHFPFSLTVPFPTGIGTIRMIGIQPTFDFGGLSAPTVEPQVPFWLVCTANFVWLDDDGNAYLGTAGHCSTDPAWVCVELCAEGGVTSLVTGQVRERTLGLVKLPVAFRSLGGPFNDFALMTVGREHRHLLRPSMPIWDGPDDVAAPVPYGNLHVGFGNANAASETYASKARAGVTMGTQGGVWQSFAPPLPGDSGSAASSAGPLGWPSLVDPVPRGETAMGIVTQTSGDGAQSMYDDLIGQLQGIDPRAIQFNGAVVRGPTVERAAALVAPTGKNIRVAYAGEDLATTAAAPRAPEASSAGTGAVLLTWLAPGDGGSPITGYLVRYATPGGLSPRAIETTATSLVVDGLADGVQHDFYVVARNAKGESVPSSVVTATPGVAGPAAPAVSATARAWAVDLAWPEPASPLPVTSYEIRHGEEPDGLDQTMTVASTSATIDGLVACRTRYFSVRALHAEGAGPSSAPVAIAPIDSEGTAPGRPLGFGATAGEKMALLQWARPAHGCTAEGFVVRWGTVPGHYTSSATTTGTSYTLEGLEDGRTYYATVAATNAHGEGSSAREVAFVPRAAPYRLEAAVEDAGGGLVRDWRLVDSFNGRSWSAAIDALAPGSYTARARLVRDGATLASASAPFVVNAPPLVDAGADRTVGERGSVALQATASDPDGATAPSVSWSQRSGPTVALSGSGASVSFTAPDVEVATALVFEATATDEDGLTATDEVTITVSDVNRAPVVTPVANRSVESSQLVSFTLRASDPDGHALSYSIAGHPAGARIHPSTGRFVWSPTFAQGGSFTMTLTASDGDVSASTTLNVSVTAIARCANGRDDDGDGAVDYPADRGCTSPLDDSEDSNAPGETEYYNESFSAGTAPGWLLGTASPDTNWPSWQVQDTEACGFSGPTSSFRLGWTATSALSPPCSYGKVSYSVPKGDATLVNPVLLYGKHQATLSFTHRFAIESSSREADRLTVHAAMDNTTAMTSTGFQQLTEWNAKSTPVSSWTRVNLDVDDFANGELFLKFRADATDTTDNDHKGWFVDDVVVTATDAPTPRCDNGVDDDLDGLVDAADPDCLHAQDDDESNVLPTLGALGPYTVEAGASLSFTLSASDADGHASGFAIVDAPAGASLDPDTGAFSWTPGLAQVGPESLRFRAVELPSERLGPERVVAVTVSRPNAPPVASAPSGLVVREGAEIKFRVDASDPDGDPVTFALSGAPAAVSVGATTGIVVWTPGFDQEGVAAFSVVVDDGLATASAAVAITVRDATRAPVFEAVAPPSGSEGVLLEVTVRASDPDGPAPTMSLAGTAPSGATFADLGGGEARLTWTPGYDQAGAHVVRFAASDGLASTTLDVTVTVADVNRAPMLGAIGPRSATEGDLLSFSLSGSDADGDALSFRAADLPAGASLDAAGAFSWRPSFAQAGAYDVRFVVSDGRAEASETVTITVADRAPRCSNGVDDDGDGETDYPTDRGCADALDDDEATDHPNETSVYSESFDTGTAAGWGGVTFGTWWNVQDGCVTPRSGGYTLAFSLYDWCHYDANTRGFADVVRQVPITLVNRHHATLSFAHQFRIEHGREGVHDVLRVDASRDGLSWTNLRRWDSRDADVTAWTVVNVDLDAFADGNVYLRFFADTGDAVDNHHLGWFIDDVVVTASPEEAP